MTKILIIDDDPDLRTLMNMSLKNQGFSVETASGRDEAFDKLQKFKPSVILLDVLLSGYDGRDICKQIRQNEQTRDIHIIMASAHPGAADNFNSYGANDFIRKPFPAELLISKVRATVQAKDN